MANDEDIFGKDLSLGFFTDDEGFTHADPYSRVDLQAGWRTDKFPRSKDIAMIEGMANLVQSLIMRLMTEQGELEKLGHPEYGSKHHTLIGEANSENNRNLIKLYILECLKQESRIEEILQAQVIQEPGVINRDKVKVHISVKVRKVSTPLNLVIPFSFA